VRARFPKAEWFVLGEGGQRDVLVQRARELGVQAHVHLMGFHDTPLRYYAAADVYLRTPIYEAENLSSYHAMAIGLPVVGFNTRCETELLEKVGHGVLVPKEDSGKLAEGIIEILSLSDKGRAMGHRGAEYSKKYLDIHQTIASYMDIYEALCSSR
jgi:glycosyltransferase involved in cell wall biosynthesis